MRIDFDRSDEATRLVAQHIPGGERGFGNGRAVAVVDHDGRLLAGLVYHNWCPESGVIELSGASTVSHWCGRNIMQFMYDYPFLTCGCQMLVQRNSANNEHLNKQNRKMGYTEHRIARLRGRDEDEIVFTFTDDQWEAHPLNLRNRKKVS